MSAAEETTLRTVRGVKSGIGQLGGAWMQGPEEEQATTAAGLQGWELYFIGRHGVLGDVDPDVVTAAAYVFPPDKVREEWERARRVLAPMDAAESYLRICHAWGRERVSDFAGAERLAELSRTVVRAADVFGLPLFAGWRAMPMPSDTAALCLHLMHLLREHRGACHGVALVASGVSPLLAILTEDGGEANAEEYGWSPPFPQVTDADRRLRREAEALTDTIVAPAYVVLSASEQAELVDLIEAALAHVQAFEA